MKQFKPGKASALARIAVGVLMFAAASAAPNAQSTQPLTFSDIAGWWVAEPSYAGESSRVGLHFLEKGGKPSARLSLFAIGGYEVPIGTVTLSRSDCIRGVRWPGAGGIGKRRQVAMDL